MKTKTNICRKQRDYRLRYKALRKSTEIQSKGAVTARNIYTSNGTSLTPDHGEMLIFLNFSFKYDLKNWFIC